MIRAKDGVLVLLVWCGLAVAGCGGYRVVEVHPGQGGVVAIYSQKMPRDKVEEYMRQQCPTGYDVLGEGEAVTGSQSQGSSTAVAVGGGMAVGSSSSTSRNVTEWRIQYKCKGTATAGNNVHVVRYY
jgi:hypothetical protein